MPPLHLNREALLLMFMILVPNGPSHLPPHNQIGQTFLHMKALHNIFLKIPVVMSALSIWTEVVIHISFRYRFVMLHRSHTMPPNNIPRHIFVMATHIYLLSLFTRALHI